MAKYIRTKENQIIVFSNSITHSDLRDFKPISAGFINFSTDGDGNPTCVCHGDSYTLDLKSIPEDDTKLATQQILNWF